MLLEKRGNIKETWAILNTVLCKQRQSVNYPTHLMQNDVHISSKQNMANEFNTFFTNVGPNLANDITNPGENISMYDYLGESIEPGARWPSGLERWLGPATGRFPGRVRIPLR